MNISGDMNQVVQERRIQFKLRQAPVAEQPVDTDDFTQDEFTQQVSATDRAVEQMAFNELLSWLAPDTDAAGRQYELIRQKLIRLFTYRRCAFPEELADETISRVTRKLPQIKSSYLGNPIKYFYGTAKKVYLEYLRRPPVQPRVPVQPLYLNPADKEELEELFQHLDEALGKLEPTDRDLILNYYQGEGQNKIAHRKALASQFGVDLNALRVRIYRIKSQLKSHLNLEH